MIETRNPVAAEIAANCLGVRARSIGRAISAVYEDALRHHRVTMPQINMMALIGNYGTATPGLVARILSMEKSTVSRNMERMVEKGWIVARPRPDGPGTELALTDAGAGVLTRAEPDWRRANARVAALLGEDSSTALREIFDKLHRPRG